MRMKNKYKRLSKRERKMAREQYKVASTSNKNLYIRCVRIQIVSILGIVYSFINIGLDFYYHISNIWGYAIDGILLIFCVFFLLKANDILVSEVNRFLIDKKK